MVARPKDVLQGLQPGRSREEVLGALKKVKNAIIGHHAKKQQFLEAGALPAVLHILSQPPSPDPELTIQALATLGSFACAGPASLSPILQHGGLQTLIATFTSATDTAVISTAARSLKLLCQHCDPPKEQLLIPPVLARLVQQLSQHDCPDVVATAATVLSACCGTTAQQRALLDAAVLPALLPSLRALARARQGGSSTAARACLDLLSRLLPCNAHAVSTLLATPGALDATLHFLRDPCLRTRLLAAACVAHAAAACPRGGPPGPSGAPHTLTHLGGMSTLAASVGGSVGGAQRDALAAAAATVQGTALWPAYPSMPSSGRQADDAASPGPAASPPVLRHFANQVVDVSPCGNMSRGLAGGGMAGASRVGGTRPPPGLTPSWPDLAAAQAQPEGNGPQGPGRMGGAAGLPGSSGTDAPQAPPTTHWQPLGCVPVPDPSQLEALASAQRAALPVVLQLLRDEAASDVAPHTLATLVEDNEELQQAAVDADAVHELAKLLVRVAPKLSGMAAGDAKAALPHVRAWEGALRALGHLSMTREVARTQLLDAKVLPHIRAALEFQGPGPAGAGVRAAGALCITALSRNVRTLRCNVLGEDIAQALCRLLADDSHLVQVNAAAALCNLVLEFSSVKEAVLATGVLDRLAANTASPLPLLRLYSAWALRNLAHKRDRATKCAIMQALGWRRMAALLHDADEGVQEQAVCTLRNLCMDAPEHISATYDWGGGELMAALEEKLDPSRPVSTSIRVHALYTIVNSLTGTEATKDQIMASNLPVLLLTALKTSGDAEIRLAAVWCIINLTWSPGGPAAGRSGGGSAPSTAGSTVESRVQRLRLFGAHNHLTALLADPSQDVRERARTALEQLCVGTTALGTS